MTTTVTNSDDMVITLNVSSIVSIVIRRHNSKKKISKKINLLKKFKTYIFLTKIQNIHRKEISKFICFIFFFSSGQTWVQNVCVLYYADILFFVSLLLFDFISRAFYVGFSSQSMTKVNEGKVRAKWKIREKRS
jgi:hypothetical protein